MNKALRTAGLLTGLAVFLFSGCSNNSYPSDKIRDSILKICKEEYGIQEIDVKIVGDTIGVFLPLDKLFASDFKETAVTGKVRNMDSLFEPSPEALEKVEDVLFSLSRVILSTDKPLKFYVLEATDVVKTGMQLVVAGYVEDMKRVRIWDISRNEYRKRLIHDLKLNHAVIWHQPVREFFKDLSALSLEEVRKKHFGESVGADTLQNLFYKSVWNGNPKIQKSPWKILDIRSAMAQKNDALVYTKVEVPIASLEGQAKQLRYIFVVSLRDERPRIVRIIPFQFQDKDGSFKDVAFPPELKMQENLDKWETEFDLKELNLGDFLAQQLTRRAQGLAVSDERIQNTFRDVKMNFVYHREQIQPFFSLDMEVVLKDFNHYSKKSLMFHEDMLYLLNLIAREFVEVSRSYQFENFENLRLSITGESSLWVFGRGDLELFRKKKIDMPSLLSVPAR